jgi:hypothetical protein
MGSVAPLTGLTSEVQQPSSAAADAVTAPMDIVGAAESVPVSARGRGRPKGSKNKSTLAKPAPANIEKRPVGRPKGSGPKQLEAAERAEELKIRRQEAALKKLQAVCLSCVCLVSCLNISLDTDSQQ